MAQKQKFLSKRCLASIGKRKAYMIYVDKRVYRRFKPIAEEMFKNVSQALEAYMMAEIVKAERRQR